MKGRYFLGTLWLVIVVLLCGILVKGLGRGKNSDGRTNLTEAGGHKMTYEEILHGDLQGISIEILSEAVTVQGTNEDSIRIQFMNHAEDYNDWSLKDGMLTITEKDSSRWLKNPKITLFVPDRKLDALEARATSGAISIRDINADTASLQANSGAIHAKQIRFRTLSAQASSGAMNISGDILQASVRTTSGAIAFTDYAELTEDSSFEANSGAIRLNLTPSNSYFFETNAKSGIIRNSLDSNRSGSVTIRAKTNSGSIRISGR